MLDYFTAARTLHENWDEVVNSGRYTKEQLSTLESVRDHPELHHKTALVLREYGKNLRLANRIASAFCRMIHSL